jgi:hypothetical protein
LPASHEGDFPAPPGFDQEEEREALLAQQPTLADASYDITSPSTARYNCVAWAAEDNQRNWSPAPGPGGKLLGGFYWPETVEMLPAVSAVEAVFRLLGYEPCDDGSLEAGIEKIVIYGDALGMALHAARQMRSGRWTSKMGDLADIEHDKPEEVEGGLYGRVRRYMARQKAPAEIETPPPKLLLPPGSR